jgi:hypothetical protein
MAIKEMDMPGCVKARRYTFQEEKLQSDCNTECMVVGNSNKNI